MVPIQKIGENEWTRAPYVFGRAGLQRVTRVDKGSVPAFPRHFTFNGALLSRDVIDSVSRLNEELFVGHEDFEYARRLHRNGFAILRVPAAMVLHNPYKQHQRVIRQDGEGGSPGMPTPPASRSWLRLRPSEDPPKSTDAHERLRYPQQGHNVFTRGPAEQVQSQVHRLDGR